MTNKSAECISFKLGDIRMLFINCHLEAHLPNLEKRNQQFESIHKKFVLKQTEEEYESKSKIICMPAKKKLRKVIQESRGNLENFDAVIWMGDMNYRVTASNFEVTHGLVKKDRYDVLKM